MSFEDSFRSASEAAKSWLNKVALVAKMGKTGSVDAAYELLMRTPGRPTSSLVDSYNEHSDVLEQSFEGLASLSDGPVAWAHGRGLSGIARVPSAVYPHRWSSAHEAAAGIARMALDLLVRPLEGITDPTEQRTLAQRLLADRSKALAIPLDEVADLQERIRRERAKLLDLGHNNSSKLQAKRTGRPRKGETDKQRLVIAALASHHKYEGRSVGNALPAKAKALAKLASNKHVTVSVATVSRFFKEKFPDRGYKGYYAACTRGMIGGLLANWQGDVSEFLADLREDEAEEGSIRTGQRRLRRPPGS